MESTTEGMDETSLQNDVDSLVRVRNRLTQSPDSALPKVLAALLPRLLVRLEQNHVLLLSSSSNNMVRSNTPYNSEKNAVQNRNDSATTIATNNNNNNTLRTKTQRALVEKSQTQLTGILTHALERIRVGRHTIPQGAPWIRSLLPLLQQSGAWESPVATTFLLLLLQKSLPWYAECMYDEYDTQHKINKNNPSTVEQQPPEDIMFLALPVLSEFVHTLHCKISEKATAIISAQATIDNTNNDSSNPTATTTMSESLLLNYRTASWLCFDILALSWGLPALVDWDRDGFDEYDWSSPCCSTAKEAFLEHGPSRHDRGGYSIGGSSNLSSSLPMPRRNFLETSGSFQMWLDFLLFWPTEENGSRQQHHRRVVRTADAIMVENSTGMTPEGVKRLNHRCKKQGQTWNHRYLRELKLACVHSVVVEPLRSLPDNSATVDDLSDNLPLLRSLLLCIVSSSPGSMHGKVSLEYVNKMGLRFAVKACRVQLASPSDPWVFGDTSLVLACCLLTLILGDNDANAVLEKHPYGRTGVNSILGQSQCTPDDDDDDNSPLKILCRAPMPFGVAERAIDFILTRLLPPPIIEGVPMMPSHAAIEAGNKDRLNLLVPVFVDLVAALSTAKGTIGCYWGIQCLDGIYSQFKAISIANKASTQGNGAMIESGDWMQEFKTTCLQISSRVLSQIAQVDAETMVTIGEIQQPTQNQAQPGGVPGPFGGRRDLNLMLAQHRTSQKKRQLQVDSALQARKKAYQMVAELSSSITTADFSSFGCNTEAKPSPVLELPIILLKCATGEQEVSMEPYVTKALDCWLVVYKSFILQFASTRVYSLDTLVASLLPSLQCAVCSESSVARFAAAKWVAEIILPVDPDIARHVCTFLADDDDLNVSEVAKKALALTETNVSMDEDPHTGQAKFFDLSKTKEMAEIKLDLESRVKCVAVSLNTSLSVSRVLLGDFKFDVANTVQNFLFDRPATIELCGLVNRSQQIIGVANGSDGITGIASKNCGICYDEVGQDEMYEMACSHPFCLPCWHAYVCSGLDERPSAATTVFSMTCPEQDCDERITREDARTVAPDALKRLDDIELQAFLVGSKNYSTCPGPDCKAVAQIVLTNNEKEFQPNTTVQCPRYHPPYCFACSGHPHQPAKCDAFAEWNRIFGSSQFWVKKNAKPCPSCKAPIEKNNGCNHIRCSLCRHDFCWLCLGHLRTHMEPHICNRYEPHESAEDDEERRALFFTERFKAHDDAEVFARNEVTAFQEKFEKLSTETLWFASDDDLESMLYAAKTLVRARNFLKNSYVAAWAMRNDLEHRSAFDSHQANLELFTENLSRLLLTNVQQLYTEQGARAIQVHFRAILFSTASLEQYMGRITNFINSS